MTLDDRTIGRDDVPRPRNADVDGWDAGGRRQREADLVNGNSCRPAAPRGSADGHGLISQLMQILDSAGGDEDRVRHTERLIVKPLLKIFYCCCALFTLVVIAAIFIVLGPRSLDLHPFGGSYSTWWVIVVCAVAVVAIMMMLRTWRARRAAEGGDGARSGVKRQGWPLLAAHVETELPPEMTSEDPVCTSPDADHHAVPERARRADDQYDAKNL